MCTSHILAKKLQYNSVTSKGKRRFYLFIYLLVLSHKRGGDNSLQMEVLFNKKKKRNMCIGKIRRMIEENI
jgi:hypothetical protein